MMGGVSDQLVLFLRTLSCNEVVLRCAKDNPLISNAMVGVAKTNRTFVLYACFSTGYS